MKRPMMMLLAAGLAVLVSPAADADATLTRSKSLSADLWQGQVNLRVNAGIEESTTSPTKYVCIDIEDMNDFSRENACGSVTVTVTIDETLATAHITGVLAGTSLVSFDLTYQQTHVNEGTRPYVDAEINPGGAPDAAINAYRNTNGRLDGSIISLGLNRTFTLVNQPAWASQVTRLAVDA
jgi:hypothetical protein